jgi:hypothetical protein
MLAVLLIFLKVLKLEMVGLAPWFAQGRMQ